MRVIKYKDERQVDILAVASLTFDKDERFVVLPT